MVKQSIFVVSVMSGLILCQMTQRCFADISTELEQAEQYEQEGRYKEAEAVYRNVLDNYPEDEDAIWAQMGMAISNVKLGNDANGAAATEELIAQFSDHNDIAEAVQEIADTYREAENHRTADELYDYIFERWPQYILNKSPQSELAVWAQEAIVTSNIRLGDIGAAQAAIEKLLADFFSHEQIAEALYNVAGTYHEAGKEEEARHLEKYILDNWSQYFLDNLPENNLAIWAQVHLTVSNIGLDGNDVAVNAGIEKLLTDFSEDPNLPQAVFDVGEKYHEDAFRYESEGNTQQMKEYFQNAIAVWEIAIDEFPGSTMTAEACELTASCYSRLGQYDKAIEYYQKVVDNRPDYEFAWNALFLLGRNYQKLKEEGLISKSEADANTKAAYRQLLEDYPDCKMAGYAQRWLSR